MNNSDLNLSPLAQKFIEIISLNNGPTDGEKISVDPVVSEVASFYEKIRNAMEYQEEEVVFRVAIERILKRRLLLGSNGFKIAEPLIKELAWAKYFPDKSIPHAFIETIAQKINLYIRLYEEAPRIYDINKNKLHDWIIEVLSADIALTINPNKNSQIVCAFMFHMLSQKITIDGVDEDKDSILFVNIKRALANEDKAFLRFHLFHQYFGNLTEENFGNILNNFLNGYLVIEQEFSHPLNEQFYSFCKRQAVPFIILKKILDKHKEDAKEIFTNPEKFTQAVIDVCKESYENIHRRVRTAIFRSIVFLLATKAVFALFVEGTVEKGLYGNVSWGFLIINILTPPLLMFILTFFIKEPGDANTKIILDKLNSIFYDPNISAIEKKNFNLNIRKRPVLNTIFVSLWFMMFGLIIWGIVSSLNVFHINPVSQAVFIFFLIIASFLMFRIAQSARVFNASDKEGNVLSILFYFAFMPFVLLGKRLTMSFSKVNIFLFLFDFIIETPFKTIFGFFDQWFTFMRSQRVKLD